MNDRMVKHHSAEIIRKHLVNCFCELSASDPRTADFLIDVIGFLDYYRGPKKKKRRSVAGRPIPKAPLPSRSGANFIPQVE